MKVSRLYLSFITLITLFIACSDEKQSLPELSGKVTYTGSTLKLLYAGELMPAKKITFSPEKSNSLQGTLTGEGITDLSQLSSIGLSGTGPAPGILPGNPKLSFPVSLQPDGDCYRFAGKGNTPYISSFSYSGKLQGDSCVLSISDVELENLSLASTIWKPMPIERDGLAYSSLPFRLVWEVDPSLGINIDLSALLKLFATTPFIPVYHDTAYSSIAQLYTNAVQTVAFRGDGNIIVRYYSSVGGATQLMTSVGNTFQYVLPQDGTLNLYPNPTTLFGRWLVAQSDPGDNPDISFTSARGEDDDSPGEDNDSTDGEIKSWLLEIAKSLIPSILQSATDGVPFTYEESGDTLSVYLDTPVIVGFLGELAKAIEQNPQIIEKLTGKLGALGLSADDLSQLAELLSQLQQILLKTTTCQIGFNFDKYQQ